jgi:hypothetical protein
MFWSLWEVIQKQYFINEENHIKERIHYSYEFAFINYFNN